MQTDLFGNPVSLQVENRDKARAENIRQKREGVRKRFDELHKFKHDGVSLSWDGIIDKLAKEFFLAKATVKNILKAR